MQTVQLVYETLPGANQRQWIYQFRNTENQSWTPGYAFTEIEFFLSDFEVMNFFTSRSSDCFLTSHLLVVKFLREGDNNVYGKIILDDDKMKENLGGKSNVVQTFTRERERIEALEKHFGIELTKEEKNAIRGRISSLSMDLGC